MALVRDVDIETVVRVPQTSDGTEPDACAPPLHVGVAGNSGKQTAVLDEIHTGDAGVLLMHTSVFSHEDSTCQLVMCT